MINIDIDRQSPEAALRQAAWRIAIGEAGYWMMSPYEVILDPDEAVEPLDGENTEILFAWALGHLASAWEHVSTLALVSGETAAT